MKKITISLFLLAVAVAAVTAGSRALLVSNKVLVDGYGQSGYMSLEVDQGQGFEISNAVPGLTGSTEMTFVNNSTVDADLKIKVDQLVNFENYCVEAEKQQGNDSSCSLQSDLSVIDGILSSHDYVGGVGTNEYNHNIGRGELAENVMITAIKVDGQDVLPGILAQLSVSELSLYDVYVAGVAHNPIEVGMIPADDSNNSRNVVIEWEIRDTAVTDPFADDISDNVFMTDAVKGAFQAVLVQHVSTN